MSVGLDGGKPRQLKTLLLSVTLKVLLKIANITNSGLSKKNQATQSVENPNKIKGKTLNHLLRLSNQIS